MDGWMDEWLYGWIEEWMNVWIKLKPTIHQGMLSDKCYRNYELLLMVAPTNNAGWSTVIQVEKL